MPNTATQFLRLEFVDDVAVVGFAEPRLIAEDVISDVGEQLYSLGGQASEPVAELRRRPAHVQLRAGQGDRPLP